MRSFQVMRYNRRTTPTSSELAQSMTRSSSYTSLPKRRRSMSLSTSEQNQDLQSLNESEKSVLQRRNTLLSKTDSSSRRLSIPQHDVTEISKLQIDIRNFYIFFLLLFLFLFLSVVYSFIRMIKSPD